MVFIFLLLWELKLVLAERCGGRRQLSQGPPSSATVIGPGGAGGLPRANQSPALKCASVDWSGPVGPETARTDSPATYEEDALHALSPGVEGNSKDTEKVPRVIQDLDQVSPEAYTVSALPQGWLTVPLKLRPDLPNTLLSLLGS